MQGLVCMRKMLATILSDLRIGLQLAVSFDYVREWKRPLMIGSSRRCRGAQRRSIFAYRAGRKFGSRYLAEWTLPRTAIREDVIEVALLPSDLCEVAVKIVETRPGNGKGRSSTT